MTDSWDGIKKDLNVQADFGAVRNNNAAALRRLQGMAMAKAKKIMNVRKMQRATIYGEVSDDAKLWQSIVGTTSDGKFGPVTKGATIKYQEKNSLVADGIVGPKTWAQAGHDAKAEGLHTLSYSGAASYPAAVDPGFIGPPTPIVNNIPDLPPANWSWTNKEAVLCWQGHMVSRGYLPVTAGDGIFGPQTKAATVKFQTDNGITGDGVVGPLTWKAVGVDAAVCNLPTISQTTNSSGTTPSNKSVPSNKTNPKTNPVNPVTPGKSGGLLDSIKNAPMWVKLLGGLGIGGAIVASVKKKGKK